MFVENLSPQEEEKNKQQQVNAPTVGGGGGGAVAGGITPEAGNFSTITPVQQAQPIQQWATAQDYLRANQPQAEALGQKVQESLTGTLESGKQAIETGAEQAQKEIAAGITPFNEALVTEAHTTPTAVAGNEQKLQDFLKQWNAAYQGPESFEQAETYTPASQAAQLGQTRAAQLGSTGGREQLIGEQFGIYGAGNKGLDQAILQQAPQYGNIQALTPQFAGLQDYLGQKSGEVSKAAEAGKATTAETKQKTQETFTGQLGEFQKNLNDRVEAARQTAQAVTDKYNIDLSSGNETEIAKTLQDVGASATEIQKITEYMSALTDLYKGQITPSQVYGANPAIDVTTANLATPEDYAKAAAYQKLTGTDFTGVLNPAFAEKAGTAPTPQTGISAARLQQYLTPKVQQRDKELLAHGGKQSSPNEFAAYLGIPNLITLHDVPLSERNNNPDDGIKTATAVLSALQREYPTAAARLGNGDLSKSIYQKYAIQPGYGVNNPLYMQVYQAMPSIFSMPSYGGWDKTTFGTVPLMPNGADTAYSNTLWQQILADYNEVYGKK